MLVDLQAVRGFREHQAGVPTSAPALRPSWDLYCADCAIAVGTGGAGRIFAVTLDRLESIEDALRATLELQEAYAWFRFTGWREALAILFPDLNRKAV